MIEDLEHSPLRERKIYRAILVPADGSSAEASCEPQAHCARCCCGGLVRLRSLGLVCVAQAGMALVMGALGLVDRWTVYPACYFSLSTFVGVWLMRDKPNVVYPTASRIFNWAEDCW